MAQDKYDLPVIENVLVGRPPAEDSVEATAFYDREAKTLYLPLENGWVTAGGAVSGPPEAHAASHATGGSDPITPGDIGAETPAAAQAKADAAAGAVATDLSNHAAESVSFHGIADAGDLILEGDSRLTDQRVPTDGSVTNAKLGDNSVTNTKIANGAVSNAKLGSNSVTTDKIAAGQITNALLNAASVTSDKIGANQRFDLEGLDVTDSSANNNSVKITPSANKSASTSVGGALNVTNTGSTGAGIVAYTNRGADAAGRLVAITQDNAANPQQVMYIKQDGTGHAVVIDNQGTGSSNLGLSVTSTNPDDTTGGFTGSQTGRAVLKATHNGSASTGNAAGLTIQLNGTNPATQGIFIDTASGYTGKLLNLRVNGVEMLVAYSDGSVEPSGGVVQRVCNLRRSTNQSIPNTTDTQVQWNAEDSDTQGWHSTVSNTDRVSPDIAGLYLVTLNISFDTSASGGRLAAVVKNGTRTFGEARTHGVFSYSGTNLSVSGLVELNGSTDYVTTKLYQDSGGAINLIGDNGTGAFVNTLSVLFLGPIGS